MRHGPYSFKLQPGSIDTGAYVSDRYSRGPFALRSEPSRLDAAATLPGTSCNDTDPSPSVCPASPSRFPA
ncbi:Uncharacterized protein pbN1_08310 [Aromatoleum bremense]|nr:Uncharacterized protein pbN1_08310 [Aromatoleum bremense]